MPAARSSAELDVPVGTAAVPAAARPLVLLLAAAVFLNYVDRGSIAVAAPLMKQELALSATAFGIVVSAFFWVYAPIQLLIGHLCDRVSVYRLFAAGVALWALATTLTGFTTGFVSLLMLRILLGLGESIAFPGSSKIICRHVPPERRGIANAAVAAALAIGPAFGTLAGGMIMVAFGWRAMFVLFGLATLLWLLPWQRVVRSFAGVAPSRAEAGFPVAALLRRRALWGTSLGHFALNYGFYFVLTWLPLYLVKQRGFSLEQMTLLATAAYAAQAASALALGWASDHWVANGRSEAVVRKALLIGGHVGLAVCIIGIATADTVAALAAWLVLTGLSLGPGGVNLYAVAQIFAGPRAAGSWVGVQNAVGNVAGIVGPIVTGLIIDRTGSYLDAFLLASAVTVAGALCWWLFVPHVEPIDWS